MMIMLFCIAPLGLSYLPMSTTPLPPVKAPIVRPRPTAPGVPTMARTQLCPRCGRYHGWTGVLFEESFGRPDAPEDNQRASQPGAEEGRGEEEVEAKAEVRPKSDKADADAEPPKEPVPASS